MLVKIQLHDGKEVSATIANFNLSTFVDTVNSSQGKMIVFGNYAIMSGAIKLIDASGQA